MTAQAAEILHYKGKRLDLTDEPLSLYLANADWRPPFDTMSTACWRGYIGEWEIDRQRLYLIGIFDPSMSETADLSELFPDTNGRIFAHWVTAELRCPIGKLLNYVHMGFASEHEQDLFITFRQGELVSERLVSNGKSSDPNAADGYGPGAWVPSQNPRSQNRD